MVLPQNQSFGTVQEQVHCFYEHAHKPVPHLQPNDQLRRRVFPLIWIRLCDSKGQASDFTF